jgi:hypothetical protein
MRFAPPAPARAAALAAVAFAAVSLAAPPLRGQLIGGAAPTSNFIPFGGVPTSANVGPATVYQQIYNAASWTSGPVTISAVRFFKVPQSVGSHRSGTYELYLSTSARSVTGAGGLSRFDFDGNRGADNVLFATRTLGGPATELVLEFLGGGFTYDPSAGNLLVDIRVVDGGPNPANRVNYRAYGGTANGLFSRVHNYADTDTGLENWGLTTEFVSAPAAVVPEPATAALAGAGLLALGLCARRRRAG